MLNPSRGASIHFGVVWLREEKEGLNWSILVLSELFLGVGVHVEVPLCLL